mgnify:CR=1 FL=1
MLRFLYRQLALDPVRTSLTAMALAAVVAGCKDDNFITLRLARYL